jgi:hypothetical protein
VFFSAVTFCSVFSLCPLERKNFFCGNGQRKKKKKKKFLEKKIALYPPIEKILKT